MVAAVKRCCADDIKRPITKKRCGIASVATSGKSLLQLPIEILLKIYVYSGNANFPKTCRNLYLKFGNVPGANFYASMRFLETIFHRYWRKAAKGKGLDPCKETARFAFGTGLVRSLSQLLELESMFKNYGFEEFSYESLCFRGPLFWAADRNMPLILHLISKGYKLSTYSVNQASKKFQLQFLRHVASIGESELFVQQPPFPIYCVFQGGQVNGGLFELVCGVYSKLSQSSNTELAEKAISGLTHALRLAVQLLSWPYVDNLIALGASVDSTLVLELERLRST